MRNSPPFLKGKQTASHAPPSPRLSNRLQACSQFARRCPPLFRRSVRGCVEKSNVGCAEDGRDDEGVVAWVGERRERVVPSERRRCLRGLGLIPLLVLHRAPPCHRRPLVLGGLEKPSNGAPIEIPASSPSAKRGGVTAIGVLSSFQEPGARALSVLVFVARGRPSVTPPLLGRRWPCSRKVRALLPSRWFFDASP